MGSRRSPRTCASGATRSPTTGTRWRRTRWRGCGSSWQRRSLPRVATYSGELRLKTAGDGDTIDITDGVERVIAQSEISDGLVSAFVVGSTAAVTTMEFERGGVRDLREALERLIPHQGDYEHNRL